MREEERPPMHYIGPGVPRKLPKRAADKGWVLVHNHVQHEADTPVGTRGFRAWTSPLHDRLIECDCGWAPLVEKHYRIRPPTDEERRAEAERLDKVEEDFDQRLDAEIRESMSEIMQEFERDYFGFETVLPEDIKGDPAVSAALEQIEYGMNQLRAALGLPGEIGSW